MRQTIFCNHYRAMDTNKTCSAGVTYDTFKGLPFNQRPCFRRNGKPAPGGCDLAQFPTDAELAAQEEEDQKRFTAIMTARQAIVDHLGGPWKRGTAGASGTIDCPVCGGVKTLRFSRAGVNGHVHARCATGGCVSWVE